jgi:hypothetical protein
MQNLRATETNRHGAPVENHVSWSADRPTLAYLPLQAERLPLPGYGRSVWCFLIPIDDITS